MPITPAPVVPSSTTSPFGGGMQGPRPWSPGPSLASPPPVPPSPPPAYSYPPGIVPYGGRPPTPALASVVDAWNMPGFESSGSNGISNGDNNGNGNSNANWDGNQQGERVDDSSIPWQQEQDQNQDEDQDGAYLLHGESGNDISATHDALDLVYEQPPTATTAVVTTVTMERRSLFADLRAKRRRPGVEGRLGGLFGAQLFREE
ncbi:hypothetical protein SLS62_008689 [Diatrype stigma]|uniref:Uncharacterized protein n=1 Tax=Diatrype stigma TaxID=117547 RepID=A0AAN9UJU2_9PEZI